MKIVKEVHALNFTGLWFLLLLILGPTIGLLILLAAAYYVFWDDGTRVAFDSPKITYKDEVIKITPFERGF